MPNLDFAADSDVGSTRVTVAVSGPANNPHFDFTSMPALPQDEVLARLIFGRSMSNLSPLQIAQLADAAASLTGGGSTSLLQSLRSQIGVDDLDIRTNDDGSTSVSAGKYLNDRTYFSLEKGDKAGSGKARIDLDIRRGRRRSCAAKPTTAARQRAASSSSGSIEAAVARSKFWPYFRTPSGAVASAQIASS